MLKEFLRLRQDVSGFRRLFSDERFDLYVWHDHREGELEGFQLVILNGGEEAHAFTWRAGKGSFYAGIWAGGWYDPTPILVANGSMINRVVKDEFWEHSAELESGLRSLVAEKIEAHREPGVERGAAP